ncbi:hypothetical protein BDZ91DRAFT_799969 [Kalaharituber pfeilii]|nr:hypothetical protein BDZ91DRAFT_799969 [Kalaharituber pfeilii]
MKFTTAFLALAFSAITVSALAVPAVEVNVRDVQVADSTLAKREAAAAPVVAPEPAVTSVVLAEDENDEEFPKVPEDENDIVKAADPEGEAFLRSLADLPEEDDDDDDDDNDDVALEHHDYIERHGIVDKIVKILKNISKTSLGKKVWNALGGGLRTSITEYLKSKAKSLSKTTKAHRNWLNNKIKGALKKVLKSIIGSWAAGKVLEIVSPWPMCGGCHPSNYLLNAAKGRGNTDRARDNTSAVICSNRLSKHSTKYTPSTKNQPTSSSTTEKPNKVHRFSIQKRSKGVQYQPPKQNKKPPTSPPKARTSQKERLPQSGRAVVVHGIAVTKKLGKVREWMEKANPWMGKIVAARWLVRKERREGKKTSSIVIYLEGEVESDSQTPAKVRLSGKWYHSCLYDWDRITKVDGKGKGRDVEEMDMTA